MEGGRILMNITTGKMNKAKKVVVYGVEGIGKSSFAARFPNPIFSDVEGSTTELDVQRFDKPTSLEMLMQQIAYVRDHRPCQTYIIDTFDWAEKLCIQAVCAEKNVAGIEDIGYGKGYSYVYEKEGRILNALDELIAVGINVVLTAHASIRKFEQPDEMGAYDRWELKLINSLKCNCAGMVKEWADMLLFANYKTVSVATDKDGKKHKAQGGIRTMYTSHHPCWDAKNRQDMPPELPFDYNSIAQLFNCTPPVQQAIPVQQPQPQTYQQPVQQTKPPVQNTPIPAPVPAPMPPTSMSVPTVTPNSTVQSDLGDLTDFVEISTEIKIPDNIPQTLKDLMNQNKVSEEEIRFVVAQKGYFPEDTPITNYPVEFINGCLVAAWSAVFGMIQENRKVPF